MFRFDIAIGATDASTGAGTTIVSVVANVGSSSSRPNVERRWRSFGHYAIRSMRTMDEKLQRSLDEILGPLMQKASERDADLKLDYARARLKKAIEQVFKDEVARIQQLIAEPGRYSVKEWEKVMSDIEWTARRFMSLREQMEEARPLTRIDDTDPKEAVLRVGGGKPKLSTGEVSQIKTLINAGELSLEEIAAKFDVSPAQVSAIKNERSWPEVEPRISSRLDRYEANRAKFKRRV
jgi:hypothetical protein